MFIKHKNNCESFLAGDTTALHELLHPGIKDLAVRPADEEQRDPVKAILPQPAPHQI
jgi:hypothetical protein